MSRYIVVRRLFKYIARKLNLNHYGEHNHITSVQIQLIATFVYYRENSTSS